MELLLFGVFIIFLIMVVKLLTFHDKNKALKEQNKQLKNHIQSVPSSVLMVNKDGSYSLQNTLLITTNGYDSLTTALGHQKIINGFIMSELQIKLAMFESSDH